MKLVAALMVAGVGVVAVGCAVETDPQGTSQGALEGVGSNTEEQCFLFCGSSSSSSGGSNSCASPNNPTGSMTVGQMHAGVIFAALAAGDLHGIPNDGSTDCNNLRNNLTVMENAMTAGYATLTNTGVKNIAYSGVYGVVYQYSYSYPGYDMSVCNALSSWQVAADNCFQDQCMSAFVVNNSGCSASNTKTTAGGQVDPGPAQLTQNLSATRGASAAATADNVAVTAWQWPSSPSTGGSFAGGEPCSSVAMSAGQSTSASIIKSGSSYQYSTCK